MATESSIFFTRTKETQTMACLETPNPNNSVTIPYGLFQSLLDDSNRLKLMQQQQRSTIQETSRYTGLMKKIDQITADIISLKAIPTRTRSP